MAKNYYISFNGTDFSQIYPVNDPTATYTQEQNTRVWRENIDELLLTKAKNSSVFDTLKSYFTDKTKFDTEIEIEIYTGTRGSGTIYYKGLFSISDITMDFERDTAKLTPLRINDDYLSIMEKADIPYELDVLTLILETKRVGYSEAVSVSGAWTNPANGFADTYDTFNASGGSILTATTGGIGDYGASIGVNPLDNNDIFIIDIKSYSKSAGGNLIFDLQYGASDTSMTDEGGKPVSTGIHAWTVSTGQASPRIVLYATAVTAAAIEFEARKIQAANDKTAAGELLMTFIENYLDTATHMNLTGYTGNVKSTFIDNDALPSDAPSTIDTFITANPNGNYVTETSDNELNNTIIGLLVEWFTVTDRPSFKLSFNDIMDQLRKMLQVYWYIDADGDFRLEHEKYFVKMVDDSTAIDLTNYPLSEVDARELKYNKQRVYSRETFRFAQASNPPFVGDPITYNNFETTDRHITYSVNYITTDIDYIINNEDDANNNGLAMFQCNLLTGITGADLYEIAISTGVGTSTGYPNAAFSWANLHDKYWLWSRMGESANINGAATTTLSAVRFLEQANVNFLYSTAIDPFTKITTLLTSGAPVEITRNLDTDFVEMIIGYDPYKL